ncbi:MAG: hypothetical protein AB7F59_15225 [Bdellovibrionales bacterium]
MSVIQDILDLLAVFAVIHLYLEYAPLLRWKKSINELIGYYNGRFAELEKRPKNPERNWIEGKLEKIEDRFREMEKDYQKQINSINEKLKKQEQQLIEPTQVTIESLQEFVEN